MTTVSQSIMISDLIPNDSADSLQTRFDDLVIPDFFIQEDGYFAIKSQLSNREEDRLLKESTASFADFVSSFMNRVRREL